MLDGESAGGVPDVRRKWHEEGRLRDRLAGTPPATATGVTVIFEVPTGLTPDVGGLTSCTTTDTGHLCTIDEGSRFPGQAPRSSIIVRGDTPGSYDVRFSVRGDQPDPNPSNNTATGTIVVLPAADVSVQVTDSADPSRPGRPVTYTVTVANHGPSPATEVTLTDVWQSTTSGGVKLQSVRTSQGTCSPPASAALQCRLGALAAGSSASVTITLRPHGKGTLTDTASVTAAEFDPANTNSETTTAGRAKSR